MWRLLMTAVLLMVGVAVAVAGCAFPAQAGDRPEGGAADGEVSGALLAASLQITVSGYDMATVAQPDRVLSVRVDELARGIGSLVVVDGEPVIVTHNHWRVPFDCIEQVTLHDRHGDVVATLDGAAWRAAVRYRDNGTLVLAVPGVPTGPAGTAAETVHVVPGETVLLVQHRPRHDQALRVTPVMVTENAFYAGKQVLGVCTLDGQALAAGDSGGGIWRDGVLIGNLWTARGSDATCGLAAELPPTQLVAGAAVEEGENSAESPPPSSSTAPQRH